MYQLAKSSITHIIKFNKNQNDLMKKILLICFAFFFCDLVIHTQPIYSQEVYVDGNKGNDNNAGTKEAPFLSIQKAMEIIRSQANDIYVMKINPGIYVLDSHVSISSQKVMTDKRIMIEAAILPGDRLWIPEKMPVITCKGKKGQIVEDYNFVAAFLVEESHVTIRGIKFHGYFYPNTRYFPIARFNKQKTDLSVEQCMFVGDKHASHIQVGVMAHGDEVKIDHCVFYNVKNAAVYWEDTGHGNKIGNSFTNCIVYGAFQCAVWFAWPDNDFVVKNNIITHCKHAWIKNEFNTTKYTIENCVIVNNQYYQGVAANAGVIPRAFEMNEINITKEGEISLKMMDENTDATLPVDYLLVMPNTLGYDLGAGLFKKNETGINTGALVKPGKLTLLQNYPNPFNPSTKITYTLDKPSQVKLTIYDLLGKEIRALQNSFQHAGEYSLVWNAKDDNNSPVSSGMYFFHLETNENTLQKKMLLVR
jgi:hypothetical protein